METVFVTGAAGFIGSSIARAYRQKGFRVIAVGHGDQNDPRFAEFDIDQWIAADVNTRTLSSITGRPDIVIHCAGDSSVGASFASSEDIVGRNLETANAVLNFACRLNRPPRVVFLSSASVYGAVDTLPIAESASLRPISPYGQAKVAIEMAAADAAKSKGLPVTVLRLFSVYGVGLRKQLFWDACRKFVSRDTEFSGTGEERRDWLHIEDAVSLIMLAAESASADCTVLNGGSGRSVTVLHALTMLHSAWGEKLPSLTFSGQSRRGDPPSYEADLSRVEALGWSARRSIESGIAEYAHWFRGSLT